MKIYKYIKITSWTFTHGLDFLGTLFSSLTDSAHGLTCLGVWVTKNENSFVRVWKPRIGLEMSIILRFLISYLMMICKCDEKEKKDEEKESQLVQLKKIYV